MACPELAPPQPAVFPEFTDCPEPAPPRISELVAWPVPVPTVPRQPVGFSETAASGGEPFLNLLSH